MAILISTGNRIRSQLQRSFAGHGVPGALLSGMFIVAALTLVAKAVAFSKDAIVAHRFGTGDALDAFLLAFSLLSFLAALIGGGLSEAFLPVHSQVRHRRGMRRAWRLAAQSALWNVTTLGMVALALFVIAPELIALTGSGFSPEKRTLAVGALRSLLPFLVLYGLTLHFATWLRADKCFALAAAAPVLPPLVIIICLVAAGGSATIDTLVRGANAGVLLQLFVLVLALRKRMPARVRHVFSLWEPANRAVLGNAAPYFLAGLVMNSAIIVDQAMAAWLEPGSVAALSYADKICGIVLALTATAASEAVFPYFADSVAREHWQSLKQNLLHVTGVILAVAVPMALLLIAFAPFVVGVLFERGSFTAADTARVAGVLRFAALQIPFYIAGVLASRVAVSLQATKFTLLASLGGMACNIGFNVLLMRRFGVAGIALSTALVHLLSAASLYIFIFRGIARRLNQPPSGIAVS